MDDKIMYAWQVVGDWQDRVYYTCARLETAEYLRDWLQAIEEDNGRHTAKACNCVYSFSGHYQLFEVQECEVIL